LNLSFGELGLASCAQITMVLVGVAGAITWLDFAYLRQSRAWIGVAGAFALIVAALTSTAEFVPLLLLAALAIWVARTTGFGLEGSDEMALIILPPLATASLPVMPSGIYRLVFLFVAAQLTLAYLASAGAKASGSKWRDGSAVAQILSTQDYGLGRRALFQSDGWSFKLVAWGAIAFEFALPLGLILGGPLLPFAIAAGVIFHAGIAMTMGLNRFLPWFIAAYPAAAWASMHYGLLSS
jgi:hypothetical protein